MNLNDRVALILGRAIIRAEEATIRAEEAEAIIKQLKTQIQAVNDNNVEKKEPSDG